MAEFINNAELEVAVGSNVLFVDTVVEPCPCVRHREGSGIFTLRGGHTYLVAFSANIGLVAGAVSLALTLGGEELAGTRMTTVPASATDVMNVSTFAIITVPCGCCYTMAVENVGDVALTAVNSNLIIMRED